MERTWIDHNKTIIHNIMKISFMKISKYTSCLIFLSLLPVITSCNRKHDEDLSFAFIGDLHFTISDSRTTDNLVQSIALEMKNLDPKPEFIIQTGDFFHGSKEIENEASMAFNNFGKITGMPFFVAKGNHDSRRPYEKNALPLFSKELGRPISESYYSFDRGNCHFIMLDCTEEKLDEQLLWLEQDLKSARSNPGTRHIFAAGHYPLWIISRAGFTRPEYAVMLTDLITRYGVDAYFCGHTHNKTATVQLVNDKPVLQIMDAAVVEQGRLFNLAPFMRHVSAEPADPSRPGILPLDEGHQIFIPKSRLLYYWGYQEGSSASYYVMNVRGETVQADWHVLDKGVVRSFKWDQPGRITDLKSPAKKVKDRLTENDLKQVSQAWLYAAPWIKEDSALAPFTLNGVPAGIIKFNRKKMAGSPFWNKTEVPLNDSATDAIRAANEIRITNPGKGRFGLAHIFLLIRLKDGRFARSDISKKVSTSFYPTEEKRTDFPDKELIDSVDIGKPLESIILNFDSVY
jgi:hypothetical protein